MCCKLIRFLKKYFAKKTLNESDMERTRMIVNNRNTLLGYFDEYFVTKGLYDLSKRDALIEGLLRDGCVDLTGRRLNQIPCEIADRLADRVSALILDRNNFKDLSFLTFFVWLQHLSLNKNTNPEFATLPYMPHLKSLQLNGCHLMQMYDWIRHIQKQCPKITYLSMRSSYLRKSRISVHEAMNRRRTIINMLPTLTHLDGIEITDVERHHANLYRTGKKKKFCLFSLFKRS